MARFLQRQTITGTKVDYFINWPQGNKMKDIGIKMA